MSGALPTGGSYRLVDADAHYGAGEALPLAAAQACLARAGLQPVGDAPGQSLLQLARSLRPARTRLIIADDQPGTVRHSTRTREELVLALSDPETGALLVRASAGRYLRRGEAGGERDGELVEALCAALTAEGAGAGAR